MYCPQIGFHYRVSKSNQIIENTKGCSCGKIKNTTLMTLLIASEKELHKMIVVVEGEKNYHQIIQTQK